MATYNSLTTTTGATERIVRVELPYPFLLTGIDPGGADGDGSTAYSVNPVSIVSRIPSAGDGSSTGYRTAEKRGFYQVLRSIRFNGERIDPIRAATTLGSLEVTFIDTPDADFATLFAARKGSKIGSLTADLNRTSTAPSASGSYTVGQAYFIANEAFVVTGTGPLAVLRAAGNTQAAYHTASTAGEQHADNIYDHPRIWRRQEVRVYFGFDHVDLRKSDELGPLRFLITSPPSRSADGSWRIVAKSYLTALDKPAFLGAFEGIAAHNPNSPSFQTKTGITIAARGDSTDPQPAFTTAADRVWLRIGDEAVETEIVASSTSLTSVTLEQRGALGTESKDLEERMEVREFIPTDTTVNTPRIGHVPYTGGAYTLTNLVASDNPLVALLCLMLSRDGDSTNVEVSGTDNSYDVLPSPIGLAIPAARVDLATFERHIDESFHAHMPRFRLGWDGPFSVWRWFSEQVAPLLGLALYTTTAGKISLARVAAYYPLDSTVSIDLSNIERRYHDYNLNAANITGRVRMRYRLSNGTKVSLNAVSTLLKDLYPDENQVLAIDSDGATEATEALLVDRATGLVALNEFAAPTMKFTLPWTHHAGTKKVEPATALKVTDAQMPDIVNGGYGVTDEVWKALGTTVGIQITGPRGVHSASVGVDAIRVEDRTAHWAPSGTVTAWDAGNKRVTIAANNFTPTATTSDVVTTTDVEAFGDNGSQGGAGLRVAFYNDDGSRWNDVETIEIEDLTHASHYIDLSAVPNVSSTPTDPTGKIISLETFDATLQSGVDGGTIHENQDDYAAQGDGSTGLIDTGVANMKWGF